MNWFFFGGTKHVELYFLWKILSKELSRMILRIKFINIYIYIYSCEEELTIFLPVYGLMGVLNGLDIGFMLLKKCFFVMFFVCKQVILCLKLIKEDIVSNLIQKNVPTDRRSLDILLCLINHSRLLFSMVKGLAIIC